MLFLRLVSYWLGARSERDLVPKSRADCFGPQKVGPQGWAPDWGQGAESRTHRRGSVGKAPITDLWIDDD